MRYKGFYEIAEYTPETTENMFLVKIPDWKMRGIKHSLLVYASLDTFIVASPGLGGTFRHSFSYELQLPLVGSGPAVIERAIRAKSVGMRDLRVNDTMIGVTAEAINVARLKINRA